LKKRYKIIVNQDPNMCVPACILMILKRHNLDKGYSQLGLATKFLKFQTSEKDKEMYPNVKIAKKFEDQGCHVNDLNQQFFKPEGIPLKETYVDWKAVQDSFDYDANYVKNLILNNDADIIVSLDYSLVNSKHKPSRHVVLIEGIDEQNNCLILSPVGIDYENITERKEATVDTLIRAMRVINGGFWIISKIA